MSPRKHASNAPGRRRRGLGQLASARSRAPELVGAELLAVDELLVAEADRERDDLDAAARRRAAAGRSHALSVTTRMPTCAPRCRSIVRATSVVIVARVTAGLAAGRARGAREGRELLDPQQRQEPEVDDRRRPRRRRRPRAIASRRASTSRSTSPTTQLTPQTTTPARHDAHQRRWRAGAPSMPPRRALEHPEGDARAPTKYASENASASPGMPSHA